MDGADAQSRGSMELREDMAYAFSRLTREFLFIGVETCCYASLGPFAAIAQEVRDPLTERELARTTKRCPRPWGGAKGMAVPISGIQIPLGVKGVRRQYRLTVGSSA